MKMSTLNGDIIINTSDDVAFQKVAGVVLPLTPGEPIAQLTYLNGKGGLAAGDVQFIDKSFVSDATIAEWLWDFGDESTSDLQHPTHTYTVNGEYEVSLTVTTDAEETDEVIDTITIELYINPPESRPAPENKFSQQSILGVGSRKLGGNIWLGNTRLLNRGSHKLGGKVWIGGD